jgi:cell wall-associated NlpC family hydrolase
VARGSLAPGAIASAAAAVAVALLLCACAGTPRIATPSGDATSSPGTAADARGAMIANALSMLGQPYRYAGAAPGGFDCSGLVFYAAAGAGLHLPRTASEQRRLGSAVSRRNLQPGDLIFMHLAGKKHPSRIELHVGIALGGQRFIHAPASGGRVRIDSIAATPYAEGFIAARRIIDGAAPAGTPSSRAEARGSAP